MSDESQSICNLLKLQTAELHKRVEAAPFLKNLLRRKASLQEYTSYLRLLAIIHATLERNITRSENALLRHVWRESMSKYSLLKEDIKDLEKIAQNQGAFVEVYSEAIAPINLALELAESIRILSLKDPTQLAGFLYVLEGSTNGNAHVYARVAETFGLTGTSGIRYLMNYGEKQPEEWRAFKLRLESAVIGDEERNAVVAGAKDLFLQLAAMLEALTSDHGQVSIHATSINPEAGSHQVPQTELELKAARIAADVCLAELPYIEARYGERGGRYTQSDSAWLATLADFSDKVVFKQTQWLGKLLSALGMPRYALEMHLREMARSLTALMPENEKKYSVLIRAAVRIEEMHREILPIDPQRQLTLKFHSRLSATETKIYKNLENILVSAVVDERIDGSAALAQTTEWIREKSNWPNHIKTAAAEIVHAAQSYLESKS